MANVIPKILDNTIRKEKFRKAEILFYDSASKLNEEWTVLYSVNWYFLDGNKAIEGETDFILISPHKGVIVVEVKGGGIIRQKDVWYTTNRYGQSFRLKNPITQVVNSKYQILDFLKSNNALKNIYIPITHMICFPDLMSKDIPRNIDLPNSIVIADDELMDLQSSIQMKGLKNINLHEKHISLITKLLKPDFQVNEKYSLIAKRNLKIINKLTKEQENVWSLISIINKLTCLDRQVQVKQFWQ